MKRHILFIYMATLLALVGVVMPVSAQQNKHTFSIRHYNGTTQKYSFSPGDRLIVSREDSLGVEHEDYVEQKFYNDNTVHSIPLTSIRYINFNGNVDEGQSFIVSTNAGKVEYDAISIQFPSGTFNTDTEVSVSEFEKGIIDGDRELSKYYKVKFNGGVRKNFKVAVKMQEEANDEFVKMQFAMMGWAQSTGKERLLHHCMDVTYSNGAYIAEIPAMEAPDDIDVLDVYFGIVNCAPIQVSSSVGTRNAKRSDYSVYDYLLKKNALFSPNHWSALLLSLEKDLNDSWISDAMTKIEEIGFRKPKGSRIKFYLISKDKDEDGCCYTTPWGKEYSVVYLNYNKLSVKYNSQDNREKDEVRKTLIHEIFHYYQHFYDPRSAPRLLFGGHSSATILEEASSVWSSRFYGNAYSSQAQKFVGFGIPSINPYKNVLSSKDCMWSERFQNIGYGSAPLLEYLTKKCGKGNEIILKMWEDRKSGDPFDSRGTIDKIARDNGVDIFSQKVYHDFIEDFGCGNLNPSEGNTLDDPFGNMTAYDRPSQILLGKKKGPILEVSKEQKYEIKDFLFGYGALVECLSVERGFNGDWGHGLDNMGGSIEPAAYDIVNARLVPIEDAIATTWVYRKDSNNKYIPCGMTRKGSPLEITPDWFIKNPHNGFYNTCKIYLVTIYDNPKTEKVTVSQMNIEFCKILDVEPKELSFDVKAGSTTLNVKSNQPDISCKSDVGWIEWEKVPDSKNIIVKVTENEDNNPREGNIIVYAKDAKGVVRAEQKIPVKQKGMGMIKVEPNTPLEFEAEGGTKTLTVTTSQPKWDVAKKGDWFKYSTSKNEITVTADPNPTSDPREGYLEIYALNENNEKVSKPVTIKVTQKSATSAATKYKWVKFVNVEFKGTVHIKSNDHTPEEWDDTWSTSIPRTISKQTMEENGLKVDVSDSGSLVKITKTLEYSPDHNHWIYKAEIYIDPVKNLITSLYVYEKFWLSTGNGDQPQVLTLRAENIPLEKEKSGTGTKVKGTILNELSNNGQSGWVVFDRKWEGADDYQIKVTLSE